MNSTFDKQKYVAEAKRLSQNGEMPSMAFYDANRRKGHIRAEALLKHFGGTWHEYAKAAGLTYSPRRKTSNADIDKAIEFIRQNCTDRKLMKRTEYDKIRGDLPTSQRITAKISWAQLADKLGLKYQGQRRLTKKQIESRKAGKTMQLTVVNVGDPWLSLIGTVVQQAQIDLNRGKDISGIIPAEAFLADFLDGLGWQP